MTSKLKHGVEELIAEARSQFAEIEAREGLALANDPGWLVVDVR